MNDPRTHIGSSQPGSARFSAREGAALDALFAKPGRLQISSSDRSWRAAVLGCVLAIAGLTLGAAPARAAGDVPVSSATLAQPAEARAPPAIPSDVGVLKRLVAEAGVLDVAATARTVNPHVYPVFFRSGLSEEQIGLRLLEVTLSAHMLRPSGSGGFSEVTGKVLANVTGTGQAPAAYAYATEDSHETGCVIAISEQHAPAIRELSVAAGIPDETALEFAFIHEAARCAQASEAVAASAEIAATGRLSPERAASGLLGVRVKALAAGGHAAAVVKPDFLDGRDQVLSAERYADGFAVLALLAQGRLTESNLERLVGMRSAAADHATGSFLSFLRTRTQADPLAVKAMRSDGVSGFDAKAVAGFLQPAWQAFEAREEAERQVQQAREAAPPAAQAPSLRDALLGKPGMAPAPGRQARPVHGGGAAAAAADTHDAHQPRG